MSSPNINLSNLDGRYSKPADVATAISAQALTDAGQYVSKSKYSISVTDYGSYYGDVINIYDASISSGSNQLSSSSTSFTSTDIGKTVFIYGAGNASTSGFDNSALASSIISVSNGVATIINNATATVSNARAWYGHDDTSAIQAAVNACATMSGAVLIFPHGRTSLVGSITPRSNISFYGYGHTLLQRGDAINGVFNCNVGSMSTQLTNVNFFGFTFVGAGTNIDENRRNALWIEWVNNIRVKDCNVSGFASGAFEIDQSSNVYIESNTVSNTCQSAGHNAINLGSPVNVTGDTSDIIIRGNIVATRSVPCPTSCIQIASSHGTQTNPYNAVISDNDCFSSSFAAISLELGGTEGAPSIRGVSIQNNRITQTGNANYYGIDVLIDSSPLLTDPTAIQDIIIQGNTITAPNGSGIHVMASRCMIQNNLITSCLGTAIYIQGTSTLVLNNVMVQNNMIHMLASPTKYAALWFVYCNNFSESSNKIYFDTGSTTVTHGIAISNCNFWQSALGSIDYAPGHGMVLNTTGNFSIRGKTIYRPGEYQTNAGTYNGIDLTASAAAANPYAMNIMDGNVIIDDRGTMRMRVPIQNNNSSSSAQIGAINNHLYGGTLGSVINTLSNWKLLRDNTSAAINPFAPTAITAGTSPYTYQNTDPFAQEVFISGGTITALTVQRGTGATAYTLPTTASSVHLEQLDAVVITYSSTPILTKFPKR